MAETRGVMAETKLVVAEVEALIGETLTEPRDRAASKSCLWFPHTYHPTASGFESTSWLRCRRAITKGLSW